MESHPSAQQQLDALVRDREQVRARLLLPWWHHIGWGVTWCGFTAGTVLLPDSNWIFLVYACTYAAFLGLWYARRRQGLRLAHRRTPMRHSLLAGCGGIALAAGMIALSLQLHVRWPFVVGNIAVAVVFVLMSRRDDLKRVARLRDEL